MTIATRLDCYLSDNHIDYETVKHNHSYSSLHSAVAANIQPVSLAKGIILEDHDGRHLMAVLPANANVNMPQLNQSLFASFHLVKEHDVYEMFEDCENGAVPPVGHVYHLPVVYDKALAELDFIYLEAGDHETLIKLSRDSFIKLMGPNSRCLHFSRHVFH
ncbi:YbaK / prolyl-tRNA synthetases associated domain protein [Vibrio aerogenes CECT 7868]|uniref:YbaK / prolyl-tRNA synthetases associated domain protein n=1 Tax=Vibrio aerogenes CECT 7868 TaxID=1216006 RepID=A0A1M5V7C8_9VIBR|nr:YbaK/EbsC family protein [Vibrio aerogenes]SHH71126.1 YbaK / prolyl-tRNA synthetases associated domain protein [Vibrio aerogenes CECT 7868]